MNTHVKRAQKKVAAQNLVRVLHVAPPKLRRLVRTRTRRTRSLHRPKTVAPDVRNRAVKVVRFKPVKRVNVRARQRKLAQKVAQKVKRDHEPQKVQLLQLVVVRRVQRVRVNRPLKKAAKVQPRFTPKKLQTRRTPRPPQVQVAVVPKPHQLVLARRRPVAMKRALVPKLNDELNVCAFLALYQQYVKVGRI